MDVRMLEDILDELKRHNKTRDESMIRNITDRLNKSLLVYTDEIQRSAYWEEKRLEGKIRKGERI